MVKCDGQSRVVVQERWPRGGICQDAKEVGDVRFHGARVFFDVSACEETASASKGYLAGTEDRGAVVGFHGFGRLSNEATEGAGSRGWSFNPLVCAVVLPCPVGGSWGGSR